MSGSLSTSQRPASRRSFRPQLEVLEGRALPSGLAPMTPPLQAAPQALVSTIQVMEAPVMVTNARVIANQVQLTPHDIKLEVPKAIHPATLAPKTTEPVKGVPVQITPVAQVRTEHLLQPGVKTIAAINNKINENIPPLLMSFLRSEAGRPEASPGQTGGGKGGSW